MNEQNKTFKITYKKQKLLQLNITNKLTANNTLLYKYA